MSIRAGYAGSTDTSEFAALSTRRNVELVALYEPNAERRQALVEEKSIEPWALAGDVRDVPDVEALFLNLPPDETARILRRAAERGLAVFCVPPVAPSLAEGQAVLEIVEANRTITSVGRPMRHAINLIQLRQTVRHRGASWFMGRLVMGTDEGNRANRLTEVCDLLRFVAGPIAGARFAEAPDNSHLHAVLGLETGAAAIISVLSGVCSEQAWETSVEAVTSGDRMRWTSETNVLTINGQDWPGHDKVEGRYVGEIGAFVTAVETGRRSPILCDLAETVEVMRVAEMVNAVGKGSR